jgi:YD repeat-containing protein
VSSSTSSNAPAGKNGRASVGHPVDVASGNLFHELEDHVLPGRMPLIFGRRYSGSLAGHHEGLFGSGWSSPFEMTLRRGLEGWVMLDEDGETEIPFNDWHDRIERGETVRDPGSFHEIHKQGEHLVVTRWDPDSDEIVQFIFKQGNEDEHWPLLGRLDLEGQGIDILRDAQGRIAELKQRREGRSLVLSYDAKGRVTEVHVRCQDTRRRVLSYRYDEQGRLCEMTDAAGQRCTYAYDAEDRMTREVNLGGMQYTFTYDKHDRCIETSGKNSYGLTRLQFNAAARMTLVTDSLDRPTGYQYNEDGQIVQVTSPLGNSTSTVYDDHGRIVEQISQEGAVTAHAFDERGDRITVISPTGAVTRYAHNEHHQVTRITDPAGQVWQRSYDAKHRVREVINPLGQRLTYSYDESGDLTAIADPAGHTRRFEWDGQGNLVSATDWRGHQTRYAYDAEGRLTAMVDPMGHRTAAELDPLGRISTVRLPDGATRQFSWDAYDQPTRYVDELENATAWSYEACGLLSEVTRPHGGRIRFDWTTEPGQLIGVVNERGERTQLAYDEGGRLTGETDFSGRQTRYAYDRDDQIIGIDNAAGHHTELERDLSGAVTRVAHDDGSETTYDYDARGLLTRADNGVCPLERSYDGVGRLICEKQGPHEVHSEHDSMGNRTRRRSSLGHDTRFKWDENGQLAQLSTADDDSPITFEYDARQDELARFVDHGVRIGQAYDSRGRRVEQRVDLWQSAFSTEPPSPVVQRTYRYDAASNLTELSDARWGTTRYTYDVLGRTLSARIPGGLAERLEYDATDNVTQIQRTTASGDTESAPCGYVAGNVLVRRGDAVYSYDELGQLVRKLDSGGDTRFEWNRYGQLAAATLPDGSRWEYSYDAFGRRVTKGGPHGTVTYIWDGDVVLHELRAVQGSRGRGGREGQRRGRGGQGRASSRGRGGELGV